MRFSLPYFFFLGSWDSFFFGALGVYRLVSILSFAAMVFMMVLRFTGYWYLQEFVDFSFVRITIFFFVIYVDTFFTIHLDMIILMEIGLHWARLWVTCAGKAGRIKSTLPGKSCMIYGWALDNSNCHDEA